MCYCISFDLIKFFRHIDCFLPPAGLKSIEKSLVGSEDNIGMGERPEREGRRREGEPGKLRAGSLPGRGSAGKPA